MLIITKKRKVKNRKEKRKKQEVLTITQKIILSLNKTMKFQNSLLIKVITGDSEEILKRFPERLHRFNFTSSVIQFWTRIRKLVKDGG